MAIKNNKNSIGFTLIEVIIVMAVFFFVIGAAISIFISIVQHQKKVLAEQQMLNQISYVEEYMSKALRMAKVATASDNPCLPDGYIYQLTLPDDSPARAYNGIRFLNQSDVDQNGKPICQEFFLSPENPMVSFNATSNPYVLKELKNNGNYAIDSVDLTPTSMQINFIKFAINGLDGTVVGMGCGADPVGCGATNLDQNQVQPKVTVLLNVKIPNDDQEPLRTIQTTVSQRNLNAK